MTYPNDCSGSCSIYINLHTRVCRHRTCFGVHHDCANYVVCWGQFKVVVVIKPECSCLIEGFFNTFRNYVLHGFQPKPNCESFAVTKCARTWSYKYLDFIVDIREKPRITTFPSNFNTTVRRRWTNFWA